MLRLAVCFLVVLCLSPSLKASTHDDVIINVTKESPDCEDAAQVGDTVAVHYTGYFEDGSIFDKSQQPIQVTLGAKMVIEGWERGILGMCVGEHRKLTIPPSLAYGESGSPPAIPPSSTLIFETELVTVVNRPSFLWDSLIPMVWTTWPVLIAVYILYNLYALAQKRTAADARRKKDTGKKRK